MRATASGRQLPSVKGSFRSTQVVQHHGPTVPRAGYLPETHKFGMCCRQDEA